jgi:hypothetical protein
MQTQATHQGFVAGLRLIPESVRHLTRMRNVWLVMLVFAALHSYSRMGVRLEGDRPDASFGKMLAVVIQTQYQWVWTHPDYPAYAVVQALRGLQRPLNARFGIVQNGVTPLADRVFGPQDPHLPPRGPRLSFEILLANLLYAVLTAGILGWIKLALERKPLAVSAFLGSVARAVGPIYCWFLLLDAVRLVVIGLVPVLEHTRVTGQAVQAVTLALLLPFLFLPSVVVAWGRSIVTAFPASLRVFGSRLAMLLGFLLVFRIVAEALTLLGTALHNYGAWVVSSHVGRFALLFAANLSSLIVALLLCTAFMLIVIRATPAVEPIPADAAPA